MDAPIAVSRLAFATYVCYFALFLSINGCDSVAITKESEFLWFVANHEYVLAYFYDSACKTATCEEALKNVDALGDDIHSGISTLEIVKVDSARLTYDLSVPAPPTLVFFRKKVPTIYMGEGLAADDVSMWLDEHREVATRSLYDDDFEHLTQASSGATTGDWLVLFYTPACHQLLPTWETVAGRLKSRHVVATVDAAANPELAERFEIRDCPTIKLFRQGRVYDFILPPDYATLVTFAEGWYKNAPSRPVPKPRTPFDSLVDEAVAKLKRHVPEWGGLVLGVSMGSLLLLGVFVCCMTRGKGEEAAHPKDE